MANSQSDSKKQRVDLRVLKTRRAIRNAFVDLLGQRRFEDITVQEIIQKAEINRKTFYNHYRDKFDLADSCMESIAAEIRELARNLRDTQSLQHIEALSEQLQAHRVETLALWDVRTETSNGLKSVIREELASIYAPIAKAKGETDQNAQRQADMYAHMASMMLHYMLEDSEGASILELRRNLAAILDAITQRIESDPPARAIDENEA